MQNVRKIGIIGASGFAGSELLRLAVNHPGVELVWATGHSEAGTPIGNLYPSLAPAYGDTPFAKYDAGMLADVDTVFLGLPHGASQALVPDLVDNVEFVIDVAADFRHKDASVYDDWYGEAHTAPHLLEQFTYGLPELYRDEIRTARLVAAPGCYPTTAILGLAPMVKAGIVEPNGVIVDAASGVSGAGRPPKPNTTFCTVDEDFTAYGLLTHRHTPEMEAHSGATVLFTPHLAPMNRGILATIYGRATAGQTSETAMAALREFHADNPFVLVSDRIPSTKATQGSNSAHLTARVDERTGMVVVLSAIDNLVKGTAGQALQCLNLMSGFDETLGLPRVGLTP